MEVLISTLLISAMFLITGLSVFLLVYRIPLFIQVFFCKNDEKTRIMLLVRWGLIAVQVTPSWKKLTIEGVIGKRSIVSKKVPLVSGTGTEEEPDTGDKKSDKTGPRDLLPFIPVILSFLSDCISHTRIDPAQGEIRYGTGDPVTTGQIFGYYHAMMPFISPWCKVRLIPDFTTIRLDGKAEGGLLIGTPGQLLIRLVRNAIPPFIRMKRGSHA